MRQDTFFNIAIPATLIAIVGAIGYAVWYDMTFDWGRCTQASETRAKHSSMWVQTIPGKVPITIVHPAQDWTEVMYLCDNDPEPSYIKWRRIE